MLLISGMDNYHSTIAILIVEIISVAWVVLIYCTIKLGTKGPFLQKPFLSPTSTPQLAQLQNNGRQNHPHFHRIRWSKHSYSHVYLFPIPIVSRWKRYGEHRATRCNVHAIQSSRFHWYWQHPQYLSPSSSQWSSTSLVNCLTEVFLPAGYPHSVSDDYLPYASSIWFTCRHASCWHGLPGTKFLWVFSCLTPIVTIRQFIGSTYYQAIFL